MLNASNVGHVVLRQCDAARREVLLQVRDGRCARDQVMFGYLRSSHTSDTCAGVARLVAAMLAISCDCASAPPCKGQNGMDPMPLRSQ